MRKTSIVWKGGIETERGRLIIRSIDATEEEGIQSKEKKIVYGR